MRAPRHVVPNYMTPRRMPALCLPLFSCSGGRDRFPELWERDRGEIYTHMKLWEALVSGFRCCNSSRQAGYSHLRLESCYFPLCLEISVSSFPEEARSAYCYQQMGPWPFCMNQPHHNLGKITHFRSIPLVQKALYFLSCTQCINRAKPKGCPLHKGGLRRHRV